MQTTYATVVLQGLPETVRRLQELPGKIAKRCLSKAARAGGAPLVKAVKRQWPQATGLSKRALTQKVKSYQDGRVVISIVGQQKDVRARKKLRKGRGGISGRGDVVPIHLIENPTKPHRIPKEFRKTQLQTTKAHRDAMRSQGRDFRRYKIERRGPLRLRLPGGQVVFVESIQHPGTRGKKILKAAADAGAAEAAQSFAAKLESEVDREAAAIAAGGQ